MKKILISIVVISFWNCGEGDSDDFNGAPEIYQIFPSIIVSGSYIYVEGKNLATPEGVINDVRVHMEGLNVVNKDTSINLEIISARDDTLIIVSLPNDIHNIFQHSCTIKVITPLGQLESSDPLFILENNPLGGESEVGKGLLGTIYALEPNTNVLPDINLTCEDESIINNEELSCPYSAIILPELNIPNQSFDVGFPGLGENLLEWFSIRFYGFIKIESAGIHTFETCSDDGSNLYLMDQGSLIKIVDNDGTHGSRCVSGDISLEIGYYPIIVDYFQGPRYNIQLQLYWTQPDSSKTIIQSDYLYLFHN